MDSLGRLHLGRQEHQKTSEAGKLGSPHHPRLKVDKTWAVEAKVVVTFNV